MGILETKINTESEKFKSNYDHHRKLSDELGSELKTIMEMGPVKRVDKHRERGKLTARERIDKLKDTETEFLEFSKDRGNDLSTPRPEYQFEGLKDGDRWCLCAARWEEARLAGKAPRVVLEATNIKCLDICDLAHLKKLKMQYLLTNYFS